MTHPGHNPATPLVKAATRSAVIAQVGIEALYYVVTPLNTAPYFFKGTLHVPMFIAANPDTIENIRKVLSIPFLPLEEWEGSEK